MFCLFGIGAVYFAGENPLGSLRRMGAGYFPTVLGCALTFIGALLCVRAFLRPGSAGGAITPVHWGVLIYILLSVAAFALALTHGGLVVALALLIGIASLARGAFKLKEVLVLIVVLCLICVTVFVHLLGFVVPVWPTWG